MDEKALKEFLCSVRGFEKEIVQKIFDSNAPCKRCLIIPGPGEFFIISTKFAKKIKRPSKQNWCLLNVLRFFWKVNMSHSLLIFSNKEWNENIQ